MTSLYWNQSPEEIAKSLESDIVYGLTEQQTIDRLKNTGKNILHSKRNHVALTILCNQFKSPLILVLLVASIITFFVSHLQDAVFILIAVVANVMLGFYQEFKADKAISTLATYLKQTTRIIRDGKEISIDTEDIVPGDIVKLNQGERIPADGKLIFTNDFQVDEAVLTGESLAISKNVGIDPIESVLGDRNSIVFAGTLVIQGSATMITCATGFKTEFGKIAALLDDQVDDETPLQHKIKQFSIRLSIMLVILIFFVFVGGVQAGYPIRDMFMTALALAVSAIPESLPIAMTVILAIGVERMAKRKGVIKKLVAAETLGTTTVILTDKTGTLTKAQMTLVDILPIDPVSNAFVSAHAHIGEKSDFIERAVVNTQVHIENPTDIPDKWIIEGKIMEVALVQGLALNGYNLAYLQDKSKVVQSLPFNSIHKFSVSLVQKLDSKHAEHKYELVFFGAPDILLQFTSLSDSEKKKLQDIIHIQALEGKRLLGVAHKSVTGISDISELHNIYEQGITLDGLIAFKDPLREGIKEVMDTLSIAGIKTVIMTGDHEGTATAIAKDLGMYIPGSVLDVSTLRSLTHTELASVLPSIRVISRVTPSDKQMLVKAFQEAGEVVAMTGDGINDAPSIKAADVGIAMGSGTEVSRSVADVVLLDDDFETIVAAVEEGRQIMKNIRKALVYLLSNVADGIILIGGAVLVGVPLPINALQMLWVNFFSDSFPALAFAFEKEKNVFLEGSVDRSKGLFTPIMKFLVGVIGLITSLFLFIVYLALIRLGFDMQIVQTFIFAAFGTYTLFVALSVRSLEQSIFKYSFISNPQMLYGVGIGFVLMIVAVYHPVLQSILGTVSLPSIWLGGVVLVGIINILLVETSKWLYRKWR